MAIHFSVEKEGFRLKEKTKLKAWITSIIKRDDKKVGDIAEVVVPAGKLQFKILEISL